ncbi:hypothetical protein [Candidatus Nitrotoga sp. 1052]|uniref:hypothetical protein n=1 Tax=Candidatus Nitrotoga sp. 1052 TaxID=2886964 RepID=UPI001EF4EF07|nr:hypothetical protein [Candidatus Nitrotoga sp. 1052]CAH1091333.1 hypothetical protein NTG1052_860022 [Candidatus Nitrotoga sp. 1052]
MKRTTIVIGLIAVGIAGCVTDPSDREREITQVGNSVTCIKPPPEVLTSGLEAKLDASVYKLGQIANANISSGQKIEKIRETLPQVQSFEVLEYRFCRMYTNGLIDKTTYNELVRQVLPSFRPQAQPESAGDSVPPKKAIVIRAQDFVRGTNVAIDQCVVGPGTLANALPCIGQPNAAEFDFSVSAAGAYRLEINYTAASSRPVKVILNGTVISDQALNGTTGNWLNSNLRWVEIGKVVLKEGSNTVRLERSDVFPHIHDLRFVPVSE